MERGWLFVHVPRTGGMAIASAVAAHARTARIDEVCARHARARDLIRVEPFASAWGRLDKFAAIRDPWSIVRSSYALVAHEAAALRPDSAAWLDPDWYDALLRHLAGPGFAAFVRREYLGRDWSGGFWRHFCCDADGSDLGLEPIRHDGLGAAWPGLARRMGLPAGTPLGRVNGRPYPVDAAWTRDLIDAVGGAFRDDVDRFGFAPPAVG